MSARLCLVPFTAKVFSLLSSLLFSRDRGSWRFGGLGNPLWLGDGGYFVWRGVGSDLQLRGGL